MVSSAGQIPVDWKQLIVQLVYIKQEIDEVDSAGLWPFRLPGVAATDVELKAVEARLGEPLDPLHRAFLLHAGGWSAFYQKVDLFSAADLIEGERCELGARMLSYLADNVLQASGLERGHLLPIAATREDLDLFVITRQSAPTPGVVVWFAGSEVDRFPSFLEYFLAMMDYSRAELADLTAAAKLRDPLISRT